MSSAPAERIRDIGTYRKEGAKYELEAQCIKRDTYEKLCQLKNWVAEVPLLESLVDPQPTIEARKILEDAYVAREWLKADSEKQGYRSPTTSLLFTDGEDRVVVRGLPRDERSAYAKVITIGKITYKITSEPQRSGEVAYTVRKMDATGKVSEPLWIPAVHTIRLHPKWKEYESIRLKHERMITRLKEEKSQKERQNQQLEISTQKLTEQIRRTQKNIQRLSQSGPLTPSMDASLQQGKVKEKELKSKRDAQRRMIKQNQARLMNIPEEIQKSEQMMRNAIRVRDTYEKYASYPYTPYQEKYIHRAIPEHGLAYLMREKKRAWDAVESGLLGAKKGTRITTEKSLSELYPPEIGTVITLVERTGWQPYFPDGNSQKGILWERERKEIISKSHARTLTTIGLNGPESYQWERSPVWALGIGQFMPGTYAAFSRKYGNILWSGNLDFEKGAKKHENAFKLQLLHFIEEGMQLPTVIQKNWDTITSDPDRRLVIYGIIAAGYNLGIVRVRERIWWENPPTRIQEMNTTLTKDFVGKKLHGIPETEAYFYKFIDTWKMLREEYRWFDEYDD